jgi:hypothetical protein
MSSFEFYRGWNHKPIVSLIIPTLNESKNLPLVLPYIPLGIVDEVILVDGRSTDPTIQVARQLLPSIRVALEKKPGKGSAMRHGYSESKGDILVVIDADGSHDPREIPRFIQALLEGADFVKGSRFAPTGGTTDMPRLRMLGNWGLTKVVNTLFAQSFTDLCYGYHAFWRHCLEFLDLKTVAGFEVDTAIYLQAVRNKLKVVEVPSFEGLRFYGSGKLKTFPDGWRVLRTIMREWYIKQRQSAPEPQVGFRSYTLRSISGLQSIPITGSAQLDGIEPAARECRLERKPRSLHEFFCNYVKEAPKEEFEHLLSAVLLEVMERLGASSGSLTVFDDELHYSKSFQVFGRTTELVPVEIMNQVLHEGIAGWAIQNRQPVLIEDTTRDPRWLPKAWEQKDHVSRSAAVVPFLRNEQVVSLLILTRPADRRFTTIELERIRRMEIYL